jgi:hypothetical protein
MQVVSIWEKCMITARNQIRNLCHANGAWGTLYYGMFTRPFTCISVLPRQNLSLALPYTLQARGLAAEAPIYVIHTYYDSYCHLVPALKWLTSHMYVFPKYLLFTHKNQTRQSHIRSWKFHCVSSVYSLLCVYSTRLAIT